MKRDWGPDSTRRCAAWVHSLLLLQRSGFPSVIPRGRRSHAHREPREVDFNRAAGPGAARRPRPGRRDRPARTVSGRHVTVSRPPGTSTSQGSPGSPLFATTAAHAPVPQDSVSPEPRSWTRMRRWYGPSRTTNSTFAPVGSRSSSSAGRFVQRTGLVQAVDRHDDVRVAHRDHVTGVRPPADRDLGRAGQSSTTGSPISTAMSPPGPRAP